LRGFYFDPYYFLFSLPALLLAFWAQYMVRSTYKKYLKVPNSQGITGAMAAQRLLQAGGLNVNIEGVAGELTDHYDPRSKVLRLSAGVGNSATVASVAIVAHEVGHAMQDAQAFALLRLRSGLVPIVSFSSWLGPIIFLAGMFLNFPGLAWAGVAAVGAAVVFALVTLPVELDASHRAMKLLEQSGLLVGNDLLKGARAVLTAAAWTYVASLAQALSTMLYYIFILTGRRRR